MAFSSLTQVPLRLVIDFLSGKNPFGMCVRKIGMVFKTQINQFVGTAVQDDVAFGLENAGVSQQVMVERVHGALNKVKMNAFLNQEPHHLSGSGQSKEWPLQV